MKLLLCSVLVTVITGVPGAGVASQPTSGLQGAWQVAEVNMTGPNARTLTFSEPRANLIIFTARHYSRVEVQSENPRPVLADAARASAEELRATWGPFVGEAGTYEVADGSITMRPIASKNPAVMGAGVFIRYTFTVAGNSLTLTQDRNQSGPFPNPFTVKAVRVE